MKKNKIFWLIYFTAFMISSCHSIRHIQKKITIPKKDSSTNNAKNLHDDSIQFINKTYAALLMHHINYKTFSAKVEVNYVDAESKNYNVTMNLRMYKDSLLWVMIAGPLGIEGVRGLVTKDSVFLLEKLNKIYTVRSINYLQDLTDLPLNLATVQELIVGNPIFADSNIVSYIKTNTDIALLSIGKLFKNLIRVDPDNALLYGSKLDEVNDTRNRSSHILYDNYEEKNNKEFSTIRSITIIEKKKIEIKLHFRQYAFDENLNFPFTAPKNYTRN